VLIKQVKEWYADGIFPISHPVYKCIFRFNIYTLKNYKRTEKVSKPIIDIRSIYWSIYIDYYMAFFISYPLSDRELIGSRDDIWTKANKGYDMKNDMSWYVYRTSTEETLKWTLNEHWWKQLINWLCQPAWAILVKQSEINMISYYSKQNSRFFHRVRYQLYYLQVYDKYKYRLYLLHLLKNLDRNPTTYESFINLNVYNCTS